MAPLIVRLPVLENIMRKGVKPGEIRFEGGGSGVKAAHHIGVLGPNGSEDIFQGIRQFFEGEASRFLHEIIGV